MMETRTLGTSGLDVSVLGLGCNNFGWFADRQASQAVIGAALDAGITFFDTANNYGMPSGESERILGETLGSRRQSVIIATKFGDQVDGGEHDRGAAPEYIRIAAERSLRNLKTDYIDLYQLHYPDPDVPIAETLGALDALVQAGKVRHIGCANHDAGQLAAALGASAARGGASFISCQNEFSLLARGIEADLLPLVEARGLGLLPFFPLANGLLTGKYRRGQASPAGRLDTVKTIPFFDKFLTPERFDRAEALAVLAERHGLSLLELALGWLSSRPVVASIIAGATSPAQVAANARAVNCALPDALWAEIDALG